LRAITKRAEPAAFAAWRASGTADWQPSYAGLRQPLKDQVRGALLAEQGYVCCYCEQRVAADAKSHIEHLVPQSVDPSRALDYGNLLCSCTNRGHCGDERGNAELPVHPLQPDCAEVFEFGSDGSIAARPAAGQRAIAVLGLDCPGLRARRRRAVGDFLAVVAGLPVTEWAGRAMALLGTDGDGQFVPHATAVVSVVRRAAGAA
jgi:uncharacterized protein (TIGR02646 family)